MASIVEELIEVLKDENKVYNELIPVANSKTNIIIKNDLEELQEVTAIEQDIIEKIMTLEKKRESVVVNMALVLNTKANELNLKKIIGLLQNQEKEHRELSKVHDELATSIKTLVEINSRNKMLIEESLDMIEFNLNLVNSSRLTPGSNTYNKAAFENDNQTYDFGAFDTKQ